MFNRSILMLCAALAPALSFAAAPAQPFTLDAAAILGGRVEDLPREWKVLSEERGAPEVAGRLMAEDFPWWDGEAELGLTLHVPPSLVNAPLALALQPRGASTVYLNGRKIGSRGQLLGGPPPAESVHVPIPLRFERAGPNQLTIRHRNPDVEAFHRAGHVGGFSVRIGSAEAVAATLLQRLKRDAMMVWLFSGIFLSFAVLHACLYLFHREGTDNLWFALLCSSTASLVFFLYSKTLNENPRFAILSEPVMNTSGVLFGLFGIRFVYGLFYDAFPRKRFLAISMFAGAIVAVSIPAAYKALGAVFIFMILSCLEMIRVAAVAMWRRKRGARLIGAGLLILGLGFTTTLLRNIGVIPHGLVPGINILPFASMVALIGSMSIALSNAIADTNRALRRQLTEVERLSAERLEQERVAQQHETERRLLQAEIDHKARELEEARALQLSMLPASAPGSGRFAVATSIATATEVGGDYYDFSEDGSTLIVAVGDATGHGMRAGTMVTATKALFGLLGTRELRTGLHDANVALLRMNLKRLAMALTLARFEPGLLRVAAAGMPPLLIRRSSGTVDVVDLEGIPLGAMARSTYAPAEVQLGAGDLVLFMTDGLPELINAEDEMFGYERITRLVTESSAATPDELIRELERAVEAWKGERPADDDITFVAVQMLTPVTAVASS